MPKFIVSGIVGISIHTEVEAPNKKAAIEEARQRGMMSFCHQCAKGNPREEWSTSGELDGDPTEIDAVEA